MNTKLIATLLTPDAITGILCFAFAAISGAMKDRQESAPVVEAKEEINVNISEVSDPDTTIMVQPFEAEFPRITEFPVFTYQSPPVPAQPTTPETKVEIIQPEPKVIVKTVVVRIPEEKPAPQSVPAKPRKPSPVPVYGRNGVKIKRVRDLFSRDKHGN